jgi:hypothetical protein
MLMLVPHECGHTISLGNARTLESSRKLSGPSAQIAIGVAVAKTVGPDGDDRNIREKICPPFQHAADQ